jgi:hypothetical protein
MVEPIFIVHNNPTGRQAPYYIANVDLGYAGLDGQVEQLWLNELGGGLFRVACIPFCAYGLSYLDVVTLDADGGYVETVHERSGHRVLRALLGRLADEESLAQLQAILMSTADRLNLGYEWNGDRFIAFDIPSEVTVDPLLETLNTGAVEGRLQFEWADHRSFCRS